MNDLIVDLDLSLDPSELGPDDTTRPMTIAAVQLDATGKPVHVVWEPRTGPIPEVMP